jgi:HK97 family phage major capsid protein
MKSTLVPSRLSSTKPLLDSIEPSTELRKFDSEFLDDFERARGSHHEYSLLKILREGQRVTGLERECSEELCRIHADIPPRGTRVPLTALVTRDLQASVPAAGGATVQLTVSEAIIEALRPRSTVIAAGGRLLTGLVGNLSLPRQLTTSTPTGIALENTVVPGVDMSFDQVGLSPKTLAGVLMVSKRLLVQSTPDMESFIRGELLASVGVAIDSAVFNGTGAAGQPKGLFNYGTNVAGGTDPTLLAPPVTFGGAATWASVCEFLYNLETANVVDDGTYSFITSPSVAAKLRQAPKVASYPEFLWNDADRVAGRKAFSTSHPQANR